MSKLRGLSETRALRKVVQASIRDSYFRWLRSANDEELATTDVNQHTAYFDVLSMTPEERELYRKHLHAYLMRVDSDYRAIQTRMDAANNPLT